MATMEKIEELVAELNGSGLGVFLERYAMDMAKRIIMGRVGFNADVGDPAAVLRVCLSEVAHTAAANARDPSDGLAEELTIWAEECGYMNRKE